MRDYASLQILLDEQAEAARERMIYFVTAYMDRAGCVPCGEATAERTVRLARVAGAWAVFDDAADRLDFPALDGLGRWLTRRLNTRAVGVMGTREGFLLRLYADGLPRDTFTTSARVFGRMACRPFCLWRMPCRGHAIRWRKLLRDDAGVAALAAAFARARQVPENGLGELRSLLGLDAAAEYGFASVDDAGLLGVITLYFHAADRVRPSLPERLWRLLRLPARCGAAVSGFLFRRRAPRRPS